MADVTGMTQAPLDIHIVTSDHSVKFTIECDEKIAREVSCAVMALILRIVERPGPPPRQRISA